MRHLVTLSLLSSLAAAGADCVRAQSPATADQAARRPNVLLIAVDDLCDWVGCLGGHPQAKTPNIDKLARNGVVFRNAHCQAPVCNPSRSSMLSGLYPETTGIYFLNPEPMRSEAVRAATLLPARFEAEGYAVSGAGKIFHGQQNRRFLPNYAGDFGGFGPLPEHKLTSFPGVRLWDWGAHPARDDLTPDDAIAKWAVDQLGREEVRPSLTAIGFYRPHVPQYAAQPWFDLYPLDSVQLPRVIGNDLDDLSPYAVALTREKHIAPTHAWVLEHAQWPALVQSYLACVSFVDAQVGKVLDALAASGHAEDTIVVLWGDHGMHLGEKQRWAKRSLWEDATRVPLLIAGPGIATGAVCDAPVELIDVYPTLLELCGLSADANHEGHSLRVLLRDADAPWPHHARTSFGPGNVAIRTRHFRFIRYRDGSEELYDHRTDPHEWANLAGDPTQEATLRAHRELLPKQFAKPLGKGSTGHQAFAAAERFVR